MATNVHLGDRVRHRINGFTGIATGATEYLQQCRQILVTPERLNKEGEVMQGKWFDEPWLDIIKAGVHNPKAMVETTKSKRVSGAPDRPHPPARR